MAMITIVLMIGMEETLTETGMQVAREILKTIMDQETLEEMTDIRIVEIENLISLEIMEIVTDLLVKEDMNRIIQKSILE